MTTSLWRGMSTSMFFRLCTRAPRTEIHSCAMGIIDLNTHDDQSSALRNDIIHHTKLMDPTAFHDFEQAGWQRAAPHYGDALADLTAQTASALLDAVSVSAGTRRLA